MSAQDVRAVLRRAQTDDDFYHQLRRDPAAALAGYPLTEEEQGALVRQDRSLYRYLVPEPAVPERAISIVITITGEHDWINVFRAPGGEGMPPAVTEQAAATARRVLGAEGGERVEMLLTLLQLLDGREQGRQA